MTEAEALAVMVPPGRRRPGKMMEGIVQIHLTRACSLSCYGCTQGSNLAGRPTFMSLNNFEAAVRSLDGYFGLVALFGGQPTLHPQFPEVCDVLARHVPIGRRGLWTNALNGHGAVCRKTFLPQNCNLNVHLQRAAYDEFRRDWPEARPFGLTEDSRHGPPWVALKDVVPDEAERWGLISGCDINRHWSAMMGQFRGELRAWFCEVAGAQSILHQDEPGYPDTGLDPALRYDRAGTPLANSAGEPLRVEAGLRWWELGMPAFAHQARKHCHDCGIPLRGRGELAQAADGAGREQVSATHQAAFRPKRPGRSVELVTVREQLGGTVGRATDYLGNARGAGG